MTRLVVCLFVALASVASIAAQDTATLPPLDPAAAAKVSYRQHVAPIVKRHCVSCHTKSDPQSELNMDTAKLFIQGGKRGPAIVPGEPDQSLAIQMVLGTRKPVMPHKQPPLPAAKIHTLRQWVLAGAKDDSVPSTAVEPIVIPKTYRTAPSIASVAFSPDGKHLAAACRSEVVILPVEGDAAPLRLPTESDLLTQVAFSPDGKTLVSVGGYPGQYGELRFYDADAGFKLRFARRIGNDTFFRGGFSPDSRTLAVGGADGAIYLLPVGVEGEVRRFDLHSDWVSAVTFSVDGLALISCSRDKTVKVSLVETGRLIRSIATSGDYLNAVAATRNLAIAAGRDRVLSAYDLKLAVGEVTLTGSGNGVTPTRPAAQYTRRLETQGGEVLDMGIDAKHSRLAVAGASSEVRVYNLPDGKRLANLTGVPAAVYAVALSADGNRVATGSFNGQVGIYDAASGKLIKQLVPVPVEGK